jgi:hypothetical protein
MDKLRVGRKVLGTVAANMVDYMTTIWGVGFDSESGPGSQYRVQGTHLTPESL